MTARPLAWPPAASGYLLAAPSFFSSAQSSSACRASASTAGFRRVAPEVLALAKVELEPETPWGSLPRFEAKPPSALVDSAASESLATGPAPSWIVAFGSLTWWLLVIFLLIW